MSSTSTVRIGLLLPDVLGTYSDRGNAIVLARRLALRGIDADVVTVTADSTSPGRCDVYVIGGGEDAAQSFATEWLLSHRDVRDALGGTCVLAVCAGLQLLGEWVEDGHGRRQRGLGILDLTTTPGPRRAVGEVVARCVIPGIGLLTGFENHRGTTRLGPGTAPLTTVIHGMGNGGDDRAEGVLASNVVGTYLHGPVLARNPGLADHLLSRVVGGALPPLEMPDQEAARRLHLARAARQPFGPVGTVRAALSRRRSLTSRRRGAARSPQDLIGSADGDG